MDVDGWMDGWEGSSLPWGLSFVLFSFFFLFSNTCALGEQARHGDQGERKKKILSSVKHHNIPYTHTYLVCPPLSV